MGFQKTTINRQFELGIQYVVLKRLENVESANQSWLEEVCNLNILFLKV